MPDTRLVLAYLDTTRNHVLSIASMNGTVGYERPPWSAWYIGKTTDGSRMYAVDSGYWNFICITENDVQWCDEDKRDLNAETPYDWALVPVSPDKDAIDEFYKAKEPYGRVKPKDGSEIYLEFEQ